MRRGPIGVMLGLAPFNYPLNEMYAMLIPALLMGNVAVLKLPAIGGLVHCLTAPAFAATLPKGGHGWWKGSRPPRLTTALRPHPLGRPKAHAAPTHPGAPPPPRGGSARP